ncbi:MAG TPA: phosphoenolpyruvate carboxykinase (ATP) [Candidatus Latescibacteria bacterium]|nr:phosphoenolpyruvate carboxykinase (ATP) [Candidatus Latescibacterota bacterium]HOS63659.1 phosphoenolpyruvate carboxykinase (ATP) [Candidatus Latescibacterota bacterium]HPK73410.1 phosphoenolpyruvate carboxykinase (ATP) [Candidatus Latescibacterota bacterium]
MVGVVPEYQLDQHGFTNLGTVHWNLSTSLLYEEAIRRREGQLAHLGPLVVKTGHHTGRSPNDKFVVQEESTESEIWWGKVNQPYEEKKFHGMYRRLLAYMEGRDVFVQDCAVGADPRYRIPIRIITEDAWQNLFARNMFIQLPREELRTHVPQFTVIAAPRFHAIPEVDGTRSEVFILVNFGKRLVIIGGTAYAGEIKKSVFTFLNYLLPRGDVLSMHCSANVGPDGDTAIFFGLSGTGKTTLSADKGRNLIGDDEHGWSDHGIFNFEGGCYAKMIRLSPEAEPDIYETTRKFGTILENVMMDANTRRLNLDDDGLTENTRGAYPLSHIPGAVVPSVGDHPKNILMLTCDAFGVMPPIAALTADQAGYYFLSGYTAKVAGTEKDMGNEPQATFSTCFGAPFLALPPTRYADLLGKKVREHKTKCWLVNTGWSGGPFGVGSRMKIQTTRALIRAALSGKLDGVAMKPDPFFGFLVPESCEGVPSDVLQPRNTWADKEAYDRQAKELAARFSENFKQYEGMAPREVTESGPKAG